MVTLVTGPVRSGKSRYAAALAHASGLRVTYLATALRDESDREWVARLDRHVRERPATWESLETAQLSEPALVAVFEEAASDRCIIVDALGTWLAARLVTRIDAFERDPAAVESAMEDEATHLVTAMLASRAHVIAIAEEVGWDVVPVAPSARLFRDVLGRMKQQLGASAGAVRLVVCGIAVDLRALGTVVT